MRSRGVVTAGIICLLVCLCNQGSDPLTGTETGNGSNGTVAYCDGKPAAGAKVTLIPSYYQELNPPSGDNIIVSTTTDSAGSYRFSNLINGYYNVFCEKDSLKSYKDSIYIADTVCLVEKAILKRPGAVNGYSYYPSKEMPGNYYCVIPGSRFYTRIDSKSGEFSIVGLPVGDYKALIVSSNIDYFQKPFTLMVKEATTDSIPNSVLLVSRSITSIEASGNSLWVGTANGLVNLQNGIWSIYGLDAGLSSSQITCIHHSSESSMWIGTAFRLALFENNKLIKNFDLTGTIEIIDVTALQSTPDGTICIGTTKGLYSLTNDNWQIQYFSSAAPSLLTDQYSGNELTDVSVIKTSKNRLLIGTHHGLYYRDSTMQWKTAGQFKNMSINAIEIIDSNSFLAGTNTGLYHSKNDSVQKIDFQNEKRFSSISCIICNGAYWYIGTHNGLFVYNGVSLKEIPLSPLNSFVTALCKSRDDTIWIGTSNGLCRYFNNRIDIIE